MTLNQPIHSYNLCENCRYVTRSMHYRLWIPLSLWCQDQIIIIWGYFYNYVVAKSIRDIFGYNSFSHREIPNTYVQTAIYNLLRLHADFLQTEDCYQDITMGIVPFLLQKLPLITMCTNLNGRRFQHYNLLGNEWGRCTTWKRFKPIRATRFRWISSMFRQSLWSERDTKAGLEALQSASHPQPDNPAELPRNLLFFHPRKMGVRPEEKMEGWETENKQH